MLRTCARKGGTDALTVEECQKPHVRSTCGSTVPMKVNAYVRMHGRTLACTCVRAHVAAEDSEAEDRVFRVPHYDVSPYDVSP